MKLNTVEELQQVLFNSPLIKLLDRKLNPRVVKAGVTFLKVSVDNAEFPDFREGLEVAVLPKNFVRGLVDLVRFSFIYQALSTQNTYHYIICYRTNLMALRMRTMEMKVLKAIGRRRRVGALGLLVVSCIQEEGRT